VLAAGSSGARQKQRTIGLITLQGADQFFSEVETGGQSAATALGDDLAITRASDTPTQISTIKSLVAQHAAAIAIDSEGPTDVKQVRPALAQARAAGIPTVSFEVHSPGSVWANQSSPA
jgi:ABC-type sugar transport system substrate-binding protein